MHLRCLRCQKISPLQRPLQLQCEGCGSNQEVVYDLEQISETWTKEDLKRDQTRSLWRYLPLYPCKHAMPDPPVGWTPCFQSERLAKRLGLAEVWLKDDSKNPSASFKDRASAIAMQWATEQQYDVIAAASTGNAGAATALLGAVLGITTRIFLPQTAPPAKVAQLLAFGAEVIMVQGSYDQAFDLCVLACEKFGWYNRNTGMNPLTREGKKSVSFEICEQMQWEPPDVVVVPVGDGNIISGVWKGFKEMKEIGWISRLPRLLAVQSEGSAAVANAFESGGPVEAVHANTIADSISVDMPRDGEAAVMAVRESHGHALCVSDEAILDAIPALARQTGVLVEPAASTGFAGLELACERKLIAPSERVLLLLTGHGLKDVQAIQKTCPLPAPIPPELAALERTFS